MKKLIFAAMIALMLAVTAERAYAFCLWDYCDDWNGCWFMCG